MKTRPARQSISPTALPHRGEPVNYANYHSPTSRPQVHTPLPTARGERKFANTLLGLLDDTAHLWFGYHPAGGRELDVILVHKDFGAFIIETKSKPVHMVHKYTETECDLEGQVSRETPVAQAYDGMYRFKTLLEDLGYESPWFTSTAAFPEITRREFIAKFLGDHTKPSFLAKHIEGLLFADDLATKNALLNRLELIHRNPPSGKPNRERGVQPTHLEMLIQATTGGAKKAAAPASPQFTVVPGRPRKESIRGLVTPGQRRSVAINGLPGSGKTQALLDIAVGHASQGRFVLFVCYNKVLATKFRQDLDAIGLDSATQERILIADLYDLRKALRKEGMGTMFRGRFGTVCVDEAQDLNRAQERGGALDLTTFIHPIVAKDAEWFFAVGRDQELYGTAPQRVIETLADKDNVYELRRKLENTEVSAQGYRESNFAQVAFDYQFDPAKAEAAAESLYKRIAKDPGAKDATYAHALKQIRITRTETKDRVATYKQVIKDELARAKDLGAPHDLMIMLPRKYETRDKQAAQRALAELGVEYLDQVDAVNRRKRLPPGHVRLVTVHSARGLQATRTILLGAHDLRFPQGEETAAYIALSRAMNGSHLVLVDGEEPSRFQNFVVNTQQAYARRVMEGLLGG